MRQANLPLLLALLPSLALAGANNPIKGTIPGVNVSGGLITVATGFTAPVGGTAAPGAPSNHLFVIDQPGTLWRIDVNTGVKSLFLDLHTRLISGDLGERGFLGMAFHPNYAVNGLLYTFTSEPDTASPDFSTMPSGTDPDHQNVILEWRVDNPANPASVVNPGSAREILRLDQPQSNHNGGCLAFGPDDMLYLGLGDGGNANDLGTGHLSSGNGQNMRTVLGKILRIDPLGTNVPSHRYGIPFDNPFVPPAASSPGGSPGCQDGRCDEIFASGFRNPWRFSFDRDTGRLYVADVGQNNIEELDAVDAGGNYGWNLKEGSLCFNPGDGSVHPCFPGPAGVIDPCLQYDHDEGTAIIGGYVYRGPKSSAVRGRYVFGDYARTFSADGRIFVSAKHGAFKELRFNGQSGIGWFLLGFAEDAVGNLYILGNATGGSTGNSGVILRPETPIF